MRPANWTFCLLPALLFLLVMSLPGQRSEPGGALVVAINKANPARDVTASELRAFYTGNVRQWPDNRRVTLVQREVDSAAWRGLMRSVLRMAATDYRRLLLNLEFQGREPLLLKTLNSNEAACNFIYNVPGAVGILDDSVLRTPGCQDRVRLLPLAGASSVLVAVQ